MLDEILRATDQRIALYLERTETADTAEEQGASGSVDHAGELKHLNERAAEVRGMIAVQSPSSSRDAVEISDRS